MLLSMAITNPVLLFAVILLIILIMPILFDKLNIPSVIGLIICGIIIGPYGFNIVENNATFELLSTIGLLYLMFLTALDLNLEEFQAYKYKSLLFGFLTFTIPLLIGYFLFRYIFHFNFDRSILFASTFSTHTLVTYPIVTKRNITNDHSIPITIGATIISDIAALTLLAVIVNNVQLGINTDLWIRLSLSVTGFLLLEFLIVPIIAKWFFRKFAGERYSHYIFVLSVLFLSSWLAEALGMEAIIGAFISGIALNKFIPKSSNLMNKIEFVGNSLFIPIFLISVGMLFDVQVIFKGYSIIIMAIIFTVAGTSAKWLAAKSTQWICGFNRFQGQLMTGLSSSHTAGTLAIILAGQRIGLVNNTLLNATIIFMLLSCIISSLITHHASKQVAIINKDSDNTRKDSQKLPEEHFLIPFINTDLFSKQVKFVSLIKNRKSPNPVSVLYVIPNNKYAEQNISSIKNNTKNIMSLGSDSELDIEEIYAIDNNVVSALARTSLEKSAYPIIIPWEKTFSLATLREERIRDVTASVDKSVYVCYLEHQLIGSKSIKLFAPPLCNLELGFELWLKKVVTLSQELSIPIDVYCTSSEYDSMLKSVNNGRKVSFMRLHEFKDWGNYTYIESQITENDIIIIIMSRKDYISSNTYFDNLPFKIEKSFKDNVKIAIYPYQTLIPHYSLT